MNIKNKFLLFSFFSLIWIAVVYGYIIVFPSVLPSGVTIGPEIGKVLSNISQSCGAGKYLQGFESNGSLICKDISFLSSTSLTNIGNHYTASGEGLYRKYFNNILNDCGNGRYVKGFNSDKKMVCSEQNGTVTLVGLDLNPLPSDLNSITYPTTTSTATYSSYFSNILSQTCGTNQAITGFNDSGVKLGCINIPQCTYAETLGDGYYVINASNALCSQGCATPGLTDPVNKCILKVGTKYIAPGFTDVKKRNTPCGGSASPCSSSILNSDSYVMGYCKNGGWGGKNWEFPEYPTNTVSYASKLLNEHIGSYWTRHCENCDETSGIKWRINNNGGSKMSRSSYYYVRCESKSSPAISGVCGAANGTTLSTAPTTNLCTTGTPSTVSGTGPWTWMCEGSNGGTNASCSANKINNGVLVKLGISAFNVYQPVYSTSVFNSTMGRMNTAQNLTPGQSCFTILSTWIKPYPWNYSEWSSAANISGPIRKFSFLPGHANSSGTCIADATLTYGPYTWSSGGVQPNAPINIQPRTCYIMDGSPAVSTFSPTSRTDYNIDSNNYQIGELVWNPTLYGAGEQYYDCVLPINGTCGTASGTTVSTVPTTNLCTTGTPSIVSGTGPWTWTCNGSAGGSNANCSANKIFSNWNDYNGYCAQLNNYYANIGDLGSYICIVNGGYYVYNSDKTPVIQTYGYNWWTGSAGSNYHWGMPCGTYSTALQLGNQLWPTNPSMTCNYGEAGQEASSVILHNGRAYFFSDWYTGVTSYPAITISEFNSNSVPLILKNW